MNQKTGVGVMWCFDSIELCLPYYSVIFSYLKVLSCVVTLSSCIDAYVHVTSDAKNFSAEQKLQN